MMRIQSEVIDFWAIIAASLIKFKASSKFFIFIALFLLIMPTLTLYAVQI